MNGITSRLCDTIESNQDNTCTTESFQSNVDDTFPTNSKTETSIGSDIDKE